MTDPQLPPSGDVPPVPPAPQPVDGTPPQPPIAPPTAPSAAPGYPAAPPPASAYPQGYPQAPNQGYPQAPAYPQAPNQGYPQAPAYPQAPGYPQPPAYPQAPGYPQASNQGYSQPPAYPGATTAAADHQAPPPGAHQVPVGGYAAPAGTYQAPATGEKKSSLLGILALVLSLVAAVVVPIVAGVAGYGIGQRIPGGLDTTDPDFLTVLSPARDQVLWAELSFWTGTILGIAAIVLGILSIRRRQGRGPGIAGIVVAALGPVFFWLVLLVTVSVGTASTLAP